MQIGVEAQRAVENRRVFVVDENDIDRTVLQFMLADDNETHEFGSAAAAEEKGMQWPPDLVVAGVLLLRAAGDPPVPRWRSAWPGVKVLAICKSGDDEAIAAARESGADDTLVHPFKLEAVRRKVDRWLGRKVGLRIPVVIR